MLIQEQSSQFHKIQKDSLYKNYFSKPKMQLVSYLTMFMKHQQEVLYLNKFSQDFLSASLSYKVSNRDQHLYTHTLVCILMHFI